MTEARYSGTPLAKKLGIKQRMKVVIVDAPNNYSELIAPIPENVELIETDAVTLKRTAQNRAPDFAGIREADILHIFTNSRDDLAHSLTYFRNLIKQDAVIWVSWYKKAARLPTEISEDAVREIAISLGLVDVKVCG